jgi:hypothetical protein
MNAKLYLENLERKENLRDLGIDGQSANIEKGIKESRVRLDRLCGLVVRVLGYRSGGPGSISGTTREKSSGSGTGSTQPREYN